MPFEITTESPLKPVRATQPARAAAADRQVHVDVLVVGAGPTGLTAASEARRHGLSVRIIERKPRRSTFSKALVVHARTLEVFEAMGIADAVVAAGTRFAALNTHTGTGRRAVRVDLLAQPWGDTAYPYWLSIPQYATEQILESHLAALGVDVEWQAALDDITDHGDLVEARIQYADGGCETIRSRWLIGCDGARSRVREQTGLHLNRADAGATFVLADVKTTAHLQEDEGHVYLHPDGLLLIVPMPEPRRWRIIAHVPTPPDGSPITIDATYLDALIHRRAGLEFASHDIAWDSQFKLSHGVVDHYRKGRIFLAGDAAHVHSPVGGQGLNTGIQDAHNLIWKLATARHLDAGAAKALLDSYEAERRPVARAMVQGTARATGALTARRPLVRRALGAIAPHLIARSAIQARLGRRVGMLEIGYPNSPLTKVSAAPTAVGRRLPNPRLHTGGRLHERLNRAGHTWIVRSRQDGTHPHTGHPRWADIPLVFLTDDMLAEPLDQLARVTLVRPDGYIAATGTTTEAVWAQLPATALPFRYSHTT
ncbi:FAD-dependent monooxygenase [Streptomyces sp. NPDC048496]|uniref:FAD-dependent monooxygenase n=1 Tax=Streptomyces sp. NPDC048496 TaxID=3365558 RepID=UPI00371F879A